MRPAIFYSLVIWTFLLAAALNQAIGAEDEPVYRTGEEAILEALEEKTEFDFVDEPLIGIVDYLRQKHGIEIQIDVPAVAELTYPGTDSATTMRLGNISLRSALNLILRDRDLTWIIADEVLLITTPEVAELHLITRVYDVGELLDDSNLREECRIDLGQLADVLKTTIEPGSWDDYNGAGGIASFEVRGDKLLIVRQTQSGHEKVAEFLKTLTKVTARHQVAGAKPAPITPDPGKREAAILKALNEKTSIDFVRTPLLQAIDALHAKHGINIMLDRPSLDDVNQAVDVPVTRQVSNVTLRSALNLMLGDLDLTWVITNEVLLITTPETAEEYMYAQVYDVTDLAKLVDEAGKPVSSDFDRWICLISSQVQPDVWDSWPAICGFEYRGARVLVVHQTREVHEEIATLLNAIKTAADKYGGDVFPVVERFVSGGS